MSDDILVSTPQPLTDASKTNPPLAPPPAPMQTTSTPVVNAIPQTPYPAVTPSPNDSIIIPNDPVSPVSIHPSPVIASEPSNQESTAFTPVPATFNSIDKPLDDSKQQMINELLTDKSAMPPSVVAPVVTPPHTPSGSSISPKKKSAKGIVLALLAILLLAIPIGVYYMSQKNTNLADIRSKAAWDTVYQGCDKDDPTACGGNPRNCHCQNGQSCTYTLCESGVESACRNDGRAYCANSGGVGMTCCARGYSCGSSDGCYPTGNTPNPTHEPPESSPTDEPNNTPAPTDEPNNPTNTPTSTPISSEPICRDIKVYKGTVQITPSTLLPGDDVTIAVVGTGNPTQARFRINGSQVLGDTDADPNWTISTAQNASGEYYIPYTVPTGVTSFLFEGETFAAGAWH